MIRWLLTALALLQGLVVPPAGSAAGGGPSGGSRATIAGELVRDPVCSTYIPRATAIAVQVGGETRHYCSTTCRDKDADAGRTPRMGRAAHG
jgi:YHS domain-containing protein